MRVTASLLTAHASSNDAIAHLLLGGSAAGAFQVLWRWSCTPVSRSQLDQERSGKPNHAAQVQRSCLMLWQCLSQG